jgi:hypothetical protein
MSSMIWILWLQLTTATVCPVGVPCAPDTVHTQQLPRPYRSQETCEMDRERQQRIYSRSRDTTVQGMKIRTSAKLWCAQVESQ